MIARLSDPSLRNFFRRYVEGTQALPLREVLAETGIILENGRLRLNPLASDAQMQLRKAWLGQ